MKDSFLKNIRLSTLSKRLIVTIFLFTGSFAFSQKDVFKFQIIDEQTKAPIQFCYVIIKGKNISAQSDEFGRAQIMAAMDDSLIIYQLGYHLKKTTITSITSNNKLVLLKAKNIRLEEVVISSKKIDTIQNNNNIVFLDFVFYDDYLLALINKGLKHNSLLLLDLQGNKISEKQLSITAETLFKDCFENTHLITKDSIYQIYYDYQKISLLKSYSISNFRTFLKPCECYHGSYYVFKIKTYRELKNTYYLFDERKKQSKQIIANIADSSAIKGFNMDYDINYFLGQRRKGAGYATSVKEINKNIDKYREELILPEEYLNLLRPVESEIKKADSLFILFDYTNKFVNTYSFSGKFLQKKTLLNFDGVTPKANIDHDTRNIIFSKLSKTGVLTLYKYDKLQNIFTQLFEVPNFYYIKNFKIKDNYLYFINKERSAALTKTKIVKLQIIWDKNIGD